MNFPYQCMCQNSGVSQGVAYGNVVVKCHHQQDPRLVNESGREEEYLTNAAIQGELSSMEPEDRQGLRDSAHGEDKVCSGQHAEEDPILCNPIDCSLPGSSVHGIFQARILEQVAISFSMGSFQPRD